MPCRAESVCTKRDILTGQPINEYMNKYKKEHKVNKSKHSFHSSYSFAGSKIVSCIVGDMCHVKVGKLLLLKDILTNFTQEYRKIYDATQFRNAATKEEFCKIQIRPNYKNTNFTADFESNCLKSRSNNIFLCPKKKLKLTTDKKVIKLNKKLRQHKCCKKSKKKKKKKSGKNKKENGQLCQTSGQFY